MSEHLTYPSVDAMLEPTVLGDLLGRPVRSVDVVPMSTKGWSSTESVFEAVLVAGEPNRVAVIKRIRWSTDWHALATDDIQGREVAIWETGVLDRLPPAMGHAVLAVARFEDGAALLMDDLDDHFLPESSSWSPGRVMGVLRSMAAMHATFWEEAPVDALGTARLERMVGRMSETRLRALAHVLPDNEFVAAFPEGWVLLEDRVGPGLARELRALADDAAPAVAALADYPTTLLHGDLREANVAWDGTRAIAVDWQPTVGPPGFELVYFLRSVVNLRGTTVDPDAAMSAYRDMLADELGVAMSWSWWQDQLDICTALEVAMVACVDGLYAHGYDPREHPPWATLRWWLPSVERGLRLIGAA